MAGLPDDFTGHDPAGRGPGAAGGARAIRCPACRREHLYEPPSLPCPCGASLKVPLLRGGVPVQVRFRSWEDSWLSMRCPHCGRSDQWPQPEFTCNCGATVRLPVDRTTRLGGGAAAGPLGAAAGPRASHPHPARPAHSLDAPPAAAPPSTGSGGQAAQWRRRAPFRPHPVRTSQDAVFTAARYLEWLGFEDLELTEAQERDGVTLLGSRMVAQVDTWTEPADVKSVECLWLQTLHAEEMAAAMFTLAGYSHQATVRGEQLLVALFSLDLAGVPQPANGAAEALMETGWTS
ncbi:hypothetical protein [Kitasatospora purpeofusca]|uniref:hypothetical protein n=1 Tax=Kitasatospora purpeofusca TaxID=67352 RepID=UPI002A5A1A06|nr:hypothetical protein [Kitasatospora purpeofusca]MDY0813593.1 hypothetical protein [Kitasatospora purpeofusca]